MTRLRNSLYADGVLVLLHKRVGSNTESQTEHSLPIIRTFVPVKKYRKAKYERVHYLLKLSHCLLIV